MKNMRTIIFSFAITCFFAVCAYTLEIDELQKKAEQGDAKSQYMLGKHLEEILECKEAEKWYLKAAENNFAPAQHALYLFYKSSNVSDLLDDYLQSMDGPVCEKIYNPKKRIYWLTRALEQGYAPAQYSKYRSILEGDGKFVSQEKWEEAMKWLINAKDQGLASAQCELARLFDNGVAVVEDDAKAVELYKMAAEQGYPDAYLSLAFKYELGEGVAQNLVIAYAWASLAAADDVTRRGSSVRDKIKKSLTREELAVGQKLSKEIQDRIIAIANGEAPPPLDFPENTPINVIVASGTGFFISENGWLTTCAHVVESGSSFSVKVGDTTYDAVLKRVDKVNDLALLKVKGTFEALQIAAGSVAELGEEVFTVGFPNPELQGTSVKLTRGEINSLSGLEDDPRFFQTNVAIQPGNSGGPLINSAGQVVGIVTGKMNDKAGLEATGSLPQDINYAIKSSYLTALIESNAEAKKSIAAGKWSWEKAEKTAEAASALIIVKK